MAPVDCNEDWVIWISCRFKEFPMMRIVGVKAMFGDKVEILVVKELSLVFKHQLEGTTPLAVMQTICVLWSVTRLLAWGPFILVRG